MRRYITRLAGADLETAFAEPIVQSWTGIKPSKPRRQSGPLDPKPYVGIYEDNVDRYMVSVRNGGITLSTRDKIDTFGNSTGADSPTSDLYPFGDDTFEGKAPWPGGSTITIRFVRPDSGGRMRFLVSDYR